MNVQWTDEKLSFEDKLQLLREGKKLVVKTVDDLVFVVGQHKVYGVYWTTVYSYTQVALRPIKPVKGYKNKLIDIDALEDWLSRLTLVGIVDAS